MPGHALTSANYQFTKFGHLSARDPSEGAKIILQLLFLTRRPILRKPKKNWQTEKNCVNVSYFILGALFVEQAPKSVKCILTKFGLLTGKDSSKGVNIILQFTLSSSGGEILRKNQWGLLKREKLHECFIFDSGCHSWESISLNLFNINLPNLVGWLQETLRNGQKLFWSYSFFLTRTSVLRKISKSTMNRRKRAKMFYISFLGALVGRARFKICYMSIYQIGWAVWI